MVDHINAYSIKPGDRECLQFTKEGRCDFYEKWGRCKYLPVAG